jgi:hypothetical protein
MRTKLQLKLWPCPRQIDKSSCQAAASQFTRIVQAGRMTGLNEPVYPAVLGVATGSLLSKALRSQTLTLRLCLRKTWNNLPSGSWMFV